MAAYVFFSELKRLCVTPASGMPLSGTCLRVCTYVWCSTGTARSSRILVCEELESCNEVATRNYAVHFGASGDTVAIGHLKSSTSQNEKTPCMQREPRSHIASYFDLFHCVCDIPAEGTTSESIEGTTACMHPRLMIYVSYDSVATAATCLRMYAIVSCVDPCGCVWGMSKDRQAALRSSIATLIRQPQIACWYQLERCIRSLHMMGTACDGTPQLWPRHWIMCWRFAAGLSSHARGAVRVAAASCPGSAVHLLSAVRGRRCVCHHRRHCCSSSAVRPAASSCVAGCRGS